MGDTLTAGKISRLILFMVLAVSVSVESSAAGKPPPPPAGAKCPVCGMFVARYPDWSCSARLKDGAVYWFDGPKDMFAWLKGRYPAAVTVRDYYSLKAVDGSTAYYVEGSDVLGPMGNELVPFRKESDARGFMSDHKGRALLRFNEITPAVLKRLE